MKNYAILFIKAIFVFAILFDINFIFLPSITTARVAFLGLLLIPIKGRFYFPKSLIYFLGVIFFVFVVVLFQFVFSHDSTQCSRLLWFIIYGLLIPVLFKKHLKNRNEFLLLMGMATGLQALLSILSFTVPAVKNLFYSLIIFTANFDASLSLRATGFASIGGAGLSVIQSIGVISILALMKFNKYGFVKTTFLWIVVLIILASTFIIGRTGLFISLFAIVIYFISTKIRIKNAVVTCLALLILSQINYTGLLEKIGANVEGFNAELFTGWIANAFSVKDNATKEDLSGMPIPPITLSTIIGTGRVVDISGIGNASGNDSGYIQTYYSLGLITAVLFYISYLIFLIYLINKTEKAIALYLGIHIVFN